MTCLLLIHAFLLLSHHCSEFIPELACNLAWDGYLYPSTSATALTLPCVCTRCLQGAFHGRTYGALSITTSNVCYGKTMGPLPPGKVIAPYPYCLHCKARKACGGLGYEVGSWV